MKEKKVNPGRIPVFKQRFNELAEEYDNNTLFADAIGLSRQTVNFWLNGDRTPDAESLKTISEKLNVSVDWLLGIAPHDVRTPNPEEKAACEYTGLSPKAIKNIKMTTSYDIEGRDDELGRIIDKFLSLENQELGHILTCIWFAEMDIQDYKKELEQNNGNVALTRADSGRKDGRKILSHYNSAKAEIQNLADYIFKLCVKGRFSKDGES